MSALQEIKGIEVRFVGTGVVIFTASVPLVIGDEITAKCLEVESVIPKGYELQLGRNDSHRCVTTTKYGRGLLAFALKTK